MLHISWTIVGKNTTAPTATIKGNDLKQLSAKDLVDE